MQPITHLKHTGINHIYRIFDRFQDYAPASNFTSKTKLHTMILFFAKNKHSQVDWSISAHRCNKLQSKIIITYSKPQLEKKSS